MRVGIGYSGFKFGAQFGEDRGLVDDVEGGCAEGPAGCFEAGAEDELGFFAEALHGFFLWGDVGFEDLAEDGGLLLGFGEFAFHDLRDFHFEVLLSCCQWLFLDYTTSWEGRDLHVGARGAYAKGGSSYLLFHQAANSKAATY